MQICEIYISLLKEGTTVWRPVKAKKLEENKYEIIGIDNYNPDDEEWQFLPGDIVKCETRKFTEGKSGLVAIEKC